MSYAQVKQRPELDRILTVACTYVLTLLLLPSPRRQWPGPSLGRPKLLNTNRPRQKPPASDLVRAVGFVRPAGQRSR